MSSGPGPREIDLFADVCCPERRELPEAILRSVLTLAVEIAREGREGRKIGTILVVGDSDLVLSHSRPLILDPLYGHPPEAKNIDDPNVRETLKELAQLDGAFVVSELGEVISGARYIDVSTVNVKVPLGLGSRHLAGASISHHTRAVAVVVSESSMVRVFDNGDLVSEIIPEVWMLRRHHKSILELGQINERQESELTVLTKAE